MPTTTQNLKELFAKPKSRTFPNLRGFGHKINSLYISDFMFLIFILFFLMFYYVYYRAKDNTEIYNRFTALESFTG